MRERMVRKRTQTHRQVEDQKRNTIRYDWNRVQTVGRCDLLIGHMYTHRFADGLCHCGRYQARKGEGKEAQDADKDGMTMGNNASFCIDFLSI